MNIRRVFDLIFSSSLLILFIFPMIIIYIIVAISSEGSAIYWSKRVGQNDKFFLMPKFRTMNLDAPDVASHLLTNPNLHITKFGYFLRKSSLDELPQLWSILTGNMSVIGYRPALHNQNDLIRLRNQYGINKFKPGLTGWAQVKGRDNLSIRKKVNLEKDYYNEYNLLKDCYIILLTIKKVFSSEDVKH